MTFKHAKFEDSVIMRSLERVAREKGMIKEEPLQKTAATKLTLTPSNSLMENILNLCAGLRVSGLSKYADELENNFLAYKRGTNELYQTDPRAGEKEVETAHPDGSHKLEGVAGDDLAVVEDILDRHLKMLDVVNKKPHGKLESSAEVLSAVKKALGAPNPASAVMAFNEIPMGGGSAFSRLMGFLTASRGVAPAAQAVGSGLELAGPGVGAGGVAGGAGAVGGAEAVGVAGAGTAATVGGVAVATVAAFAAAVLVGAVAGGYVGYSLFDHYYSQEDFKDAGGRVISEESDIRSDWTVAENTAYSNWENTFKQAVALYPIIAKVKDNASPENIKSSLIQMKKLDDVIYQCRKHGGAVLGYANAHADDQFAGFLRGFKDVALAMSNFLKVAAKINAVIDDFFNQAADAVEAKIKKEMAPKPGAPPQSVASPDTQKVLQGYDAVVNSIKLYKERINARELPNAPALTAWLDKAGVFAAKYKSKLDSSAFKSDPDVLASATKNLEAVKSKVEAFRAKWLP